MPSPKHTPNNNNLTVLSALARSESKTSEAESGTTTNLSRQRSQTAHSVNVGQLTGCDVFLTHGHFIDTFA